MARHRGGTRAGTVGTSARGRPEGVTALRIAPRLDGSEGALENRSSVNHDITTTETPAPSEISEPTFTDLAPPPAWSPPPRPGPIRRLLLMAVVLASGMGRWLNVLLVITTFGTMYVAGGPIYALCAILILGSHEMGHYLFCRWYRVDATLPYFLPAPPPFLFGTFGAVIRMRPPIPSRRALFDIGIAGPIAGFLVAIPVLVIGVATSHVAPSPPETSGSFGESLLVTLLIRLFHGAIPEGSTVFASPALIAGWLGLLVTSMNLFPVGQLDGGHVSFAISPKTHPGIARLVAVSMMVLVLISLAMRILNPWLLWTVILLILSRFRHPPVEVTDEPLGGVRIALALAAALIFIVSFIPVPIEARF